MSEQDQSTGKEISNLKWEYDEDSGYWVGINPQTHEREMVDRKSPAPRHAPLMGAHSRFPLTHKSMNSILAHIERGGTLAGFCRKWLKGKNNDFGRPDMSEQEKVDALAKRIDHYRRYCPEFKTAYQAAKEARGDSWAEEAIETARSVQHKDDVPVANLKVKTLMWGAERTNKDWAPKGGDGESGKTVTKIVINTGVPEREAIDVTQEDQAE